jgi:hypothetical protein
MERIQATIVSSTSLGQPIKTLLVWVDGRLALCRTHMSHAGALTCYSTWLKARKGSK